MGSFCDLQTRVSIVGAGPAGFALAADLERNGISVLLYSHPAHLRHANDVGAKGYLGVSGIITGSFNPCVTIEMNKAVRFSEVMILAVPSTGQETVLQELKKFDLRQHTIISVPGNLFSLIADAEIEAHNILETNLSPYACRMENGNLVISGKKSHVSIAALQRDLTPEFKDRMERIFPVGLKWCNSIIEVCLSNVNGVFHPLMMLMNAGRIESTPGDFFLYRDGLTRSVSNAILAVDNVRREIGQAFGLPLKSAIEVSNECYSQHFTDLVDLAQNSPPHSDLKAPVSMANRNISEDVPDLLVSWHSLAEKLGIDASPIRAVVILAEMATGNDYMKTGRNLQKLHLGHVPRFQFIESFHTHPLIRKDSGISIEDGEGWKREQIR